MRQSELNLSLVFGSLICANVLFIRSFKKIKHQRLRLYVGHPNESVPLLLFVLVAQGNPATGYAKSAYPAADLSGSVEPITVCAIDFRLAA